MKAPSKKEWSKAYYFIMFLTIWVAYALRAWAMPEHVAVYVAVLVILGLAAASARVAAARSEDESGDASLRQQELEGLGAEILERARRKAR